MRTFPFWCLSGHLSGRLQKFREVRQYFREREGEVVFHSLRTRKLICRVYEVIRMRIHVLKCASAREGRGIPVVPSNPNVDRHTFRFVAESQLPTSSVIHAIHAIHAIHDILHFCTANKYQKESPLERIVLRTSSKKQKCSLLCATVCLARWSQLRLQAPTFAVPAAAS